MGLRLAASILASICICGVCTGGQQRISTNKAGFHDHEHGRDRVYGTGGYRSALLGD